MHAGKALGSTGLALAHAIAQALGGRYDLPHGAMNALSLPPTLRFNEPAVGDTIRRLGAALGTDDAAARVEELAALGGFGRLRDFGVPEAELPARRRSGRRATGRAREPAQRVARGRSRPASRDVVRLTNRPDERTMRR